MTADCRRNRGGGVRKPRTDKAKPEHLDVYYDGQCPMCASLMDGVRSSAKAGEFRLHDMHKARSMPFDAAAVEHMLHELLDQISREEQSLNLEKIRSRIAASIACHAAIKVNMPLEQNKMEWLLAELAKTDHPMSCPHGRPVVLRYSVKDIQKAFKRI